MNDSPANSTAQAAATDLVGCFLANADMLADKVCLHFQKDDAGHYSQTTFRQLALDASGFAEIYRQAGLTSGDLVLIFLDHHPRMYASFLGAMMAGCVPSFMPCPSPNQDPKRYWSSHQTVLERITPKALVAAQDQAEAMTVNGLHAESLQWIDVDCVVPATEIFQPGSLDATDIAFLQHSSGTTGLKKGVALSHQAVLNQVRSYAGVLRLGGDDTIVSWLPVYHDMGLIACMIMPLMHGITTVMMAPLKWAMRPVMLFEAIERFDGRYVWLPNFAFEHLCKTTAHMDPVADLSRVSAFINCSEPCKLETLKRFAEAFVGWGVRRSQLQVCYAMAENVFAVTQTPSGAVPQGARPGAAVAALDEGALTPSALISEKPVCSVGFAIPGVEVCIRDAAGTPVPDGTVGEITVQGHCLFDGYFKLPDITAARLEDGYYRTRDMGFTRAGELYVLGRMDDLIIANGKNYYAHDLEALVSEIEGVKPGRCVAFGLFNDDLGSEDVIVVAEALPGIEDQQAALRRAIKKAIFDDCGLLLKDTRIVGPEWLVKTSSGKISRQANRTKYTTEKKACP